MIYLVKHDYIFYFSNINVCIFKISSLYNADVCSGGRRPFLPFIRLNWVSVRRARAPRSRRDMGLGWRTMIFMFHYSSRFYNTAHWNCFYRELYKTTYLSQRSSSMWETSAGRRTKIEEGKTHDKINQHHKQVLSYEIQILYQYTIQVTRPHERESRWLRYWAAG